MSRGTARVVGVLGGAAALLLLALVLALPAPARAQQSGLPDGYVGADTCKGCHEEAFDKFAQTRMGRLFLKGPRNQQERLACETCHGPGKAHVDAGGGKGKGGLITFAKNDPTPVDKRNEVCVGCHAAGDHLLWKGSAHEARGLACTNCHRVMEHVSARAQLAKATVIDTCGRCHQRERAKQSRSGHMPVLPGRFNDGTDGKMTCTSCHNPHGTITQTLLREPSVNDTCYTCHAEKRGPFLFEHAPVPESCSNCHDPHGSSHEKMLIKSKPRLCQECHDPTRHPTTPYGRETSASNFKHVLGRQCVTCHVNIHGSNHPDGFAFTR